VDTVYSIRKAGITRYDVGDGAYFSNRRDSALPRCSSSNARTLVSLGNASLESRWA